MYVLARILNYADGSGSYIDVKSDLITDHKEAMALAKAGGYDCLYIFSDLSGGNNRFISNLGRPQ